MTSVVWLTSSADANVAPLFRAGLDPRLFFDISTAKRFVLRCCPPIEGDITERTSPTTPISTGSVTPRLNANCPILCIIASERSSLIEMISDQDITSRVSKYGIPLFCCGSQPDVGKSPQDKTTLASIASGLSIDTWTMPPYTPGSPLRGKSFEAALAENAEQVGRLTVLYAKIPTIVDVLLGVSVEKDVLSPTSVLAKDVEGPTFISPHTLRAKEDFSRVGSNFVELLVPPPPGLPLDAKFIGDGCLGTAWKLKKARLVDQLQLSTSKLLGKSTEEDVLSLTSGNASPSVHILSPPTHALGSSINQNQLHIGPRKVEPTLVVRCVPEKMQHTLKPMVEAQLGLCHERITGPLKIEYTEDRGLKHVYYNAYRADLKTSFTEERLPPTLIFRILKCVLQGLAALHKSGLIMRHISPREVVFDYDHHIKLSSTYCVPQDSCGMATEVIRTSYAAPEGIVSKKYSPAGDMWSIGCLIYRLITGQRPYTSVGLTDAERLELIEGMINAEKRDPEPNQGSTPQLRRSDSLLGKHFGNRHSNPYIQTHFFDTIPTSLRYPPLLSIMQRCLVIDPAQRPTPLELLAMPELASDNLSALTLTIEASNVADTELQEATYQLEVVPQSSKLFAEVREAIERTMLKQARIHGGGAGRVRLVQVAKVKNEILRHRFNICLSYIGRRGVGFFGAPRRVVPRLLRYGLLPAAHPLIPPDEGWEERAYHGTVSKGAFYSRSPMHAAKYTKSNEPIQAGDIIELIMLDVALGNSHEVEDLETVTDEAISQLGDDLNTLTTTQTNFALDTKQCCPAFVIRIEIRRPRGLSAKKALSGSSQDTTRLIAAAPQQPKHRYLVLMNRTLGRGTYASVKLGIQLPAGKPVAVKVFHQSSAAESLGEYKMMQNLREFAHITKVYHYEVHNGTCYMFMELLAASVLDLIEGIGPLSESVVKHYMRQAAEGLECLRLEGMIHRDVKPANLGIAFDGTIKISDLGISSAVGAEQHRHCGLYPQGSPVYWSPELLRGSPHTHASDVWALAASAVQMLSGKIPYSEIGLDSVPAIVLAIGSGNVKPTIPDDVYCSVHLKQLLDRCFSVDPAGRPTLHELSLEATYEDEEGLNLSVNFGIGLAVEKGETLTVMGATDTFGLPLGVPNACQEKEQSKTSSVRSASATPQQHPCVLPAPDNPKEPWPATNTIKSSRSSGPSTQEHDKKVAASDPGSCQTPPREGTSSERLGELEHQVFEKDKEIAVLKLELLKLKERLESTPTMRSSSFHVDPIQLPQ